MLHFNMFQRLNPELSSENSKLCLNEKHHEKERTDIFLTLLKLKTY